MNKLRQWSMLTALGVVAVLAAGWFLAVSPQRHHAAQLRTDAASKESQNASLQSQVSQLEQQKKGLPAQQRLLDKIDQKIPGNPELPSLIRQLTAAAEDAGVDLVSMAPSTPSLVGLTPGATGTTTTPTTTTPAAPAAPLAQIALSMTVHGSYYNIESFFAALEKMRRAVLVPGWTLTPLTDASAASASSDSGSTSSTVEQVPPGTLNAAVQAVVFESPKIAAPPSAPVASAPAS